MPDSAAIATIVPLLSDQTMKKVKTKSSPEDRFNALSAMSQEQARHATLGVIDSKVPSYRSTPSRLMLK